jgi:hypothetical protein
VLAILSGHQCAQAAVDRLNSIPERCYQPVIRRPTPHRIAAGEGNFIPQTCALALAARARHSVDLFGHWNANLLHWICPLRFALGPRDHRSARKRRFESLEARFASFMGIRSKPHAPGKRLKHRHYCSYDHTATRNHRKGPAGIFFLQNLRTGALTGSREDRSPVDFGLAYPIPCVTKRIWAEPQDHCMLHRTGVGVALGMGLGFGAGEGVALGVGL